MVATQPMRNFIESKDAFICPEDNNTGKLYNAFMCSIPKHPIIGKAIEIVVHNTERELYTSNSLDITGPGVLAEAFRIVTKERRVLPGKYNNGVKILSHDGSQMTITSEIIGIIFKTKYEGYTVDRKWYNTNPHYSDLWDSRLVYKKYTYPNLPTTNS